MKHSGFGILFLMVSTAAWACKPCDDRPLSWAARISTTIVVAKALKVSGKPQHYKLLVKQTLKGNSDKTLEVFSPGGPTDPCVPQPFIPPLNKEAIYFLVAHDTELSFASYCAAPTLPIGDDGRVQVPAVESGSKNHSSVSVRPDELLSRLNR